jgi:hypothetical protein
VLQIQLVNQQHHTQDKTQKGQTNITNHNRSKDGLIKDQE